MAADINTSKDVWSPDLSNEVAIPEDMKESIICVAWSSFNIVKLNFLIVTLQMLKYEYIAVFQNRVSKQKNRLQPMEALPSD
ncbi:hypothetical protein CEXT_267431 [Caerostris extrusa]|uniref:Uncharacterized protein n=1 Tax=Caerostris extrusa TaxID=172846 RepID=A0AAV4QLJ1_CAEEX|nr:hypothetical protein CEXT_267431 [Caerostris extrusa]